MNAELYISFLIISTLFIITPGPNVWLIVSTSISSGRQQGLMTVLGTSSAMAVQLIIAVIGSVWFISLLAESFFWLKWIGVIYLIFLGVRQIFRALKTSAADLEIAAENGSFYSGFIVSVTNPKTIVFFVAFFPQFIDATMSISFQMLMLSASFLVLAIIFDSLYVFFAVTVRELLNRHINRRREKLINGGLLLGLGAILASSRQN